MIVRACMLALLLMGVQGALNSQPSLFGKKVSSLGAGIVKFYPDAAVLETLKIAVAVAFVFAIYGTWLKCADGVWQKNAGKKKTSKAPRSARLLTIAIAVVSYLLIALAGAVEYPALYESATPAFFAAVIFRLSFFTSPAGLVAAGVILLLLPVVPGFPSVPSLVFRARKKYQIAWVQASACVLAAFMLAWLFMPRGSFNPGSGKQGSRESRIEANGNTGRPNVIWIAIDSLRLDRVDREGFLPAIQAFRDDPDTISFRRHHVGVPRTFPSWIEMIQGRYAAETGVRHMFPGFPARDREFEGIVSLAQKSGYRTFAVSDFAGDIFPRFSAGFDVVKAPGLALGTLIRQNIDQMFPLFTPVVTSPGLRGFFPSLKASPAYAAPRHLESLVGDVLDERRETGQRPMFLALFYSTAHFPYSAPWPYYRAFSKPSYPGPFWFQKNPSLTADDQNLDGVQIEQVRALYDGALKSIDDSFGSLVSMLRAEGIWDNSIVVVTADHGEDLFEAGVLQGHGDHLRGDQTLRVPLMIKQPANARRFAARQFEHVSRSIDLAPTVAALAGISGFSAPRHDLQGFDLSSGPAGVSDLPAYSETEIWFSRTGSVFYQKNRLDYPGISQLLTFDPGHSGEIILNPKYEKMLVVSKHRSIVHGQWKLIYMPTRQGVRYELYDVIRDPGNENDLAAAKPDILATMKSRFLAGVRKIEPRTAILDDFIVPEGI